MDLWEAALAANNGYTKINLSHYPSPPVMDVTIIRVYLWQSGSGEPTITAVRNQ
jgi:hypothetical protein